MNPGTILVTGATGYVGSRLVPLLLERGYRVRASSRSLDKLRKWPWFDHPRLEPAAADMADRETVLKVCEGCEAAFYLVHSMDPAQKDFARADREAAENMGWAAERAGLGRMIYLGGLGEDQDNLSHHLKSRAEVEAILRGSAVPLTTLKAAMIVGVGSASFEILRYLVERLPVMVTPRWVHTKSQPIGIKDVLDYLIGCLEKPETTGGSFDIGGPDVLTYREIMNIYSEAAGLAKRLVLPVPVLTPKLSSYWIHLVTPVHASLARPLAEGLRNEVICREERIRSLVPIRPTPIREAIRQTTAAEQHENPPLAGKANPHWRGQGDPAWAGGTVFRDRRAIVTNLPPGEIWNPLQRIGGSTGWYYANWLWQSRGFFDKLIGGVGMRKGRSDPKQLCTGDEVDFWRVKDATRDKRLLLEGEMKLPGYASLEFRIRPLAGGRTELEQTALFIPHGLLGILYWYAVLPFHHLIFPGMLARIVRAAGERASRHPEDTREAAQAQEKIAP